MSRVLLILITCIFSANALAEITTEDLKKQIDALAEELHSLKFGDSKEGFGQTSAQRIMQRIQGNRMAMGGYGEFVYSDASSELEDGTSNSKSDPVWDAQRWILYLGYDLSPKWSLFTEIEIEHADEIYLEQAFLSYKHSDAITFNVGVLLAPIGITNLYHEPTTFFATQRPLVEKYIIPTTWRENGISMTGTHKNFRYQAALLKSLNASQFSSSGVRGGRQKASKSMADGISFAGQLDYLVGSMGYVGASVYHGGVSGVDSDVDQSLWDVHANMNYKGLEFRTLYTQLRLSGAEDLNAELGLSGFGVAEQMSGYFVEVGYNLLRGRSEKQKLIPFLRYGGVNTQETAADGFTTDSSLDQTNLTVGVNFKPLPTLVLKADYAMAKNQGETGYDTVNLGVGWNF